MAVRFGDNWGEEIAKISTREEFQNCKIQIIDPNAVVYDQEYDPLTDTYGEIVNDGEVYFGQARYIPVRAGVPVQGEAQANATTLRYSRVQIPPGSGPKNINKGFSVLFAEVPKNPSLEGRRATVLEDYQGSTIASRTFHVMIDVDAGDGS